VVVVLREDECATDVTARYAFPAVAPRTAVVVHDRKQRQALFLGVNNSDGDATCVKDFEAKVPQEHTGLSLTDIKCAMLAVQNAADGQLLSTDFHRGINILALTLVALKEDRAALEHFLVRCVKSSTRSTDKAKTACARLKKNWSKFEEALRGRSIEDIVPGKLSRIVLINATRRVSALSA
jgi:hypothetical protein